MTRPALVWPRPIQGSMKRRGGGPVSCPDRGTPNSETRPSLAAAKAGTSSASSARMSRESIGPPARPSRIANRSRSGRLPSRGGSTASAYWSRLVSVDVAPGLLGECRPGQNDVSQVGQWGRPRVLHDEKRDPGAEGSGTGLVDPGVELARSDVQSLIRLPGDPLRRGDEVDDLALEVRQDSLNSAAVRALLGMDRERSRIEEAGVATAPAGHQVGGERDVFAPYRDPDPVPGRWRDSGL